MNRTSCLEHFSAGRLR